MAKKKQSALQEPVAISAELEAIVGKGPLSRTEVTKRLWAYIKQNHRQDPHKKRMIIPDAKLEKVFGKKGPVDMFEMTSLVSRHYRK
jgi:chromatin remodeling complex protein RSC6